MKPIYLLILFFSISLAASSQFSKHIIRLTDKKGTQHTLATPSTFLSSKSIARRTTHHIPIDSTDLPLSAAYLDSIAAVPNVVIYNKSKWLNQVLIRTDDPAALAKINSFSFVKSTQKVANYSRGALLPAKFGDEPPVGIDKPTMLGTNSTQGVQGASALNYGNSVNQIQLHEGEFLHNRGFSGQGIEMAVMDAGFRSYLTNPAFDSVRLQNRILGTWDFVANEASVNEDHNHGADCFSIIAANRPGAIVGSAPHAKFWLFRTEDVNSEMPVEEQNWIAAAEFADSAGVQIFSTSLGYNDFDDPALSYDHSKRDGNTAMITRAADLAARKGILVTNSAGNYGDNNNDSKYVLVPADGDSVLAVGAVDVNGLIGSFSSYGPNGAGKIKPNVVSVGVGTVYARANGNPSTGSGTSFSNPNLAGLIACLWQAFPHESNMSIIDAVQRSAHKYTTPDNRYGHGIPNFRKAYQYLMAKTFSSSFSYKDGHFSIRYSMFADSSVTFILEKKTPDSSQFKVFLSAKTSWTQPIFAEQGSGGSLMTTATGEYAFRMRVVIGSDTSFYSPEYKINNALPASVANSLKINADINNCKTTVEWQMRDDAAVVYNLERQLPGTNVFTKIATFKGSGGYDEQQPKSYSYIDPIATPETGLFQYRLKVQLGTDTTFYSANTSFTTSVPCYDRQGYFFTPSPFNNEVLGMLNTTVAASKLEIVIHDVNGRAVSRHRGSKPAGFFHVRIPTYSLAHGVYFATIYLDNKAVYRQKIVK
jgi:serine protease AprX